MKRTSIKITSEKLDLQACYRFVEDPICGGISVFVGTVRNDTQGKEVKQLDFSAYKDGINFLKKSLLLSLYFMSIFRIRSTYLQVP